MSCKFCYNCGTLMDESGFCQNTSCKMCGKSVKPLTFDSRAMKDKVGTSDYIKNHSYTPTIAHFNCCERCEYIMWHTINWCPKCGGKFQAMKMPYSELREKYAKFGAWY